MPHLRDGFIIAKGIAPRATAPAHLYTRLTPPTGVGLYRPPPTLPSAISIALSSSATTLTSIHRFGVTNTIIGVYIFAVSR